MGETNWWRYGFEGNVPEIDASAHVSRRATLVGDVAVGADASVWPGVVLRGDVGPVRIGRESHVGDNAVLHAAVAGDRVMIGHGAVLNECAVDDGALVGFNATVNTGVTIGSGSIVASGTVVPEHVEIPAHSFARGVPARIAPLEETAIDAEEIFERYSTGEYTGLADRHGDLFVSESEGANWGEEETREGEREDG
ncbi:gamma carbonic anhydrase family protein [Halegenticoccus tardaugens]|uniref:gamma carbonic anhydrase family protein n=1 Tax=Halegenticoccus tardaugens TaxID=2071624 RepID=UPI00100BAF3D|nr:gamma carbonic anhydrase family protein [Halegenticoccus tardaugens]